ncbi:Membrane protein YdfJ [Capillimicrobium parvum]|uniref:Membrane protein YdfJ n=1 Tax=Capillimicrobium parvum TaxID=2884022 RepID=A0A9E6Y2Q4_9ACTN|nr:Membrane protein YdfJ [Capillimicrobium parvum]
MRRRWIVLICCLMAVVGLGLAAGALGTRTSDNFALPGTGSQRAQDLLVDHFPAATKASSPVVFAAAEGRVDRGANRAAVDGALKDLRAADDVADVSDPFTPATVSRDGRIAYATVTLDGEPQDLTHAAADDIVAATDAARSQLTVAVGGIVGQQAEAQVEDPSEAIGLAIAVIVLLVTFGSVVSMGLPLLTGLIGLGAGLSLVTVLGHLITVPTIGPTLGTMIGLGVGIDYALFLITRHRQNLAAGMTVAESIPRTVATSGNAVVFAGGTVVVALCSLALTGIPIVSSLGYSAAIVVAIAVLAAIVLLPCLMALVGTKINALPIPGLHRRAQRAQQREGVHGWARWARAVADRPWPALIAGLAILVALMIPVFSLHLGQADNGTAAKGSEQRVAFDLLSEGFGPGSNGPLLVAVPGAPQEADLTRLAAALTGADGVASVSPPIPAQDGQAALLTVTPTTAPGDLATEALVRRLRNDVIAPTGIDAQVGGQTAAGVDLAAEISDRLPLVIAFVLALSFLLLLLAFRSIVLPIKAAVMNLLSIGAAYGVVTLVFQEGFGISLIGLSDPVPIVSFVPLMMFAILFGLSMDYEVFLLSACHERWIETHDPRTAVVDGIASTGRVITSAALIMVSVFAAFVGNADPTVKQFGLGMAVAVAVDATVVRCLLVPAVMILLGRSSWWLPAWLDRRLPHVSVEGAPAPALAVEAPEPVAAGGRD